MLIALGLVGFLVVFFAFGWISANIRDARIAQFKRVLYEFACQRVPEMNHLSPEEVFALFCMCQRSLGIRFDPSRRPIDKAAVGAIFHEMAQSANEFRERGGGPFR